MHLGFDVTPDLSLKHLLITKMSSGLIEIWNSAHPEAAVKPGDLIIEVNGQKGLAVNLMKQIIQKQMLTMKILSQAGWPIVISPEVKPTPPPLHFKSGDCGKSGHGWGAVSICLSNQQAVGFPAGSSVYHCPWESMMLMSAKSFGGCGGVKIDCTGTNAAAVLELYRSHDNNVTHPPEGSLETVEYAHCCITHQCKAGPACGEGPWIQGKSVSPYVGVANPCGAAGCARLFSKWAASMKTRVSSLPVIVAGLVSAAILTGLAFALRRTQASPFSRNAANSHVLLCSGAEELHCTTDEESPHPSDIAALE